MAGSVTIQERVENEGFPAAFGGGGRGIGSVIRIEHAWPARCRLVIGILLRGRRGLRRGVRRQVERALASAAPERKHSRAQKDDGPSRRFRAVIASHEKIPNAAGTIQTLPCSGETWTIMKLQRNSCSRLLSPTFALFRAA